MPIRPDYRKRMQERTTSGPTPRMNREIFSGGDYPTDWDGIIGQEQAKAQLQAAVRWALTEDKTFPHTLLASGLHGIGKTTIAQLLGFTLGVRFLPVSGAMTVEEFAACLQNLSEKDVIFWDEFHLAVAGNKNRADWLLPFMTDRVLMTKKGARHMPDVTIVAATTEAGKVPQTILSRFMLKPVLEAYTASEGRDIARQLARRMKVRLPEGSTEILTAVAAAADNNPRAMREIFTNLAFATDVHQAIEWAGYTSDGLTKLSVDMLLVMLGSANYRASQQTIASMLGEPGKLTYAEQQLMQRGYLTIQGSGRVLTDDGIERAKEAFQNA